MTDHIFRAQVLRPLVALAFVLTFVAAARSAPIIITDNNSTRAVAVDALTKMRDPFQITAPGQLNADHRTRVVFFVLNLDLLAGEDARALSVDAEDGAGNKYELKAEDVRDVPNFAPIKQVTVLIDPSMDNVGDVLVRVNLHGVASNRARISMGRVTAAPSDDAGVTPQPAPLVPPAPTPTPAPNPFTGAASAADTVRFLEQASWGPTTSEVARVQAMGLRPYINEQFSAPFIFPADQYGAANYPDLTLMPSDNTQGCPQTVTDLRNACLRDNYTMFPLQAQFFRNAINFKPQSDQLRQRVAWALHQIMVESGRDINQPSWMAYYLQILDRDAFGNFRTLLQDITLNPGMGRYLDTVGNSKTAPNENYAREIMQLFSVGLYQLNTDGTYKLDAQGNLIPTYDQTTVTQFARVFTGLNFAAAPVGTQGVVNYKDPMIVRETNHDTNPKTLLNGATIPGSQTTMADINAGLDNIFNHPNVGPFIGKQLIQHLVTSNPSPAYVERVARVFNNDCDALYAEGCTGGRGEMKAVVRAILLDPEARGDVKTDPKYGRLREPVQLINNVLRAYNASAFHNPLVSSDGVIGFTTPLGDLPGSLDQSVFLPTTVFSYYTPSYSVPGTKLLGPAFEILSTSTTLRRANVINTLLYQSIPNFSSSGATEGTQLNLDAYEAMANNPAQMVDAFDFLLLHGTMSAAMKTQIINAVNSVPTTDANYQRKRARTAAYLVATSPQYQVQR
ncbi:MAG: hypothetical protein QOE33_1504 [Acidobacteriota bacterium]|nr:hypothetical protein [Acidobacteriota bacterium]